MYQHRYFFDLQRNRPWTSANFRSRNGICELFNAFFLHGARIPPEIDVFSMFRDIMDHHRPYVIYNHHIQLCLANMVVNADNSCVFMHVLRATLMDALVPFCIFIHTHFCEHVVETIRMCLLDTVFAHDRSIVYKQWPEWNHTQKIQSTNYNCPITLEPIVSGAIASDGHMYERVAILKQMVSKCISPLTREPLDYELVSYNGLPQ
jgi:hypothetical protein